MDVETYLNTTSWKGVERAARHMLEGKVPSTITRSERVEFKQGMLRWALSDKPAARLQWEAIANGTERREMEDRDAYVEALWAAVWERPEHQDLRDFIERRWAARSVYQRYFFSWFLSRSYFPGALRLYSPGRSAVLLFGGLLVGWLATWLTWWSLDDEYSVGASGLGVLWLLAGWGCSGLHPRLYTALLLPRLSASVIVGYLFLAAAPDLVRLIHEGAREHAAFEVLLAALLAVGLCGYTMFHISRWVQPAFTSLRALAGRAAPVLALGVFYSSVLLALLGRLLFSASFLYGPIEQGKKLNIPSVEPRPVPLLLAATIALALGVVLELAWEDKPLTEPL